MGHYCPNNGSHAPSQATARWLADESAKDIESIVEDLYDLIADRGWVSRVRLLCKLCTQRPELLSFANGWRNAQGASLLSGAIQNNLRSTVQLLWASGITCGIDGSKRDNYFILMKLCDAAHGESHYDWFTGKNEFAARVEREGGMVDASVRVSLMWNC